MCDQGPERLVATEPPKALCVRQTTECFQESTMPAATAPLVGILRGALLGAAFWAALIWVLH